MSTTDISSIEIVNVEISNQQKTTTNITSNEQNQHINTEKVEKELISAAKYGHITIITNLLQKESIPISLYSQHYAF